MQPLFADAQPSASSHAGLGQLVAVAHAPAPVHATSHRQAAVHRTPSAQLLAPPHWTSQAPLPHRIAPSHAPAPAQATVQLCAPVQSSWAQLAVPHSTVHAAVPHASGPRHELWSQSIEQLVAAPQSTPALHAPLRQVTAHATPGGHWIGLHSVPVHENWQVSPMQVPPIEAHVLVAQVVTAASGGMPGSSTQ